MILMLKSFKIKYNKINKNEKRFYIIKKYPFVININNNIYINNI